MLKGRQRRWTRKNRRLFVVGPCRLSAPPRPGAGATGVTGGVSGSAERKRAADPPPPPGFRFFFFAPGPGRRLCGVPRWRGARPGAACTLFFVLEGFSVPGVRARAVARPRVAAALGRALPGFRLSRWVWGFARCGGRCARSPMPAKRGVPLSVLCPCGHRLVLRLWGNLVPRSLCSSPRGAWLLRRRIAVGCVGCGFCGRAVCLHCGKPPARFSFHRVASRWVACLVPDARPDRCGGGAG